MVADCFVEYFTGIAQGIDDSGLLKLTEEQLRDFKSVQDIRDSMRIVNGPKFSSSKVSQTEVQSALANLNTNNSYGHDGLSNKVLKLVGGALVPSLTKIFNTCIDENYWPVEWKRGDWVPVYKKDNPRDVRNYRPMTVLSTLGKVFEQLLGKQLTIFMEPRLNRNLTAYRKKNSCEITLVKLVGDWKWTLDNKHVIGILSTDLSKAYDSLHPPLLLAKLWAYGFSESAIDMRCYFTERKNRVRMRSGDFSEWRETSRGCPQGSNLGPLLWNIFQNDLVQNIHTDRLAMYADDHQVYSAGQKTEDVETILNDEGTRTSEWYQQNLLKCNQDKFHALSLGPGHKKKRMNLNIKEINIKSSSGIDLLGVAIDDDLNFTKHINNVCTKGERKVGVLMRFRNLMPTEAKLRIFKAFILPQVTYRHIVLHHCRSSDERKLKRLQERAMRAIYCDRASTYEALLDKARLPTLCNRRLQDMAIFMCKVKTNLVPPYISERFSCGISRYNLRNADDFYLPRYNTVTYGRHSLRNQFKRDVTTETAKDAFTRILEGGDDKESP
ncbi:RNA-directed DNA polymerase from mobile element jockey [Stylophora pistillata]|uniref:RNA-directed DNA polymerase from mobile element jockey n=1 Tax=Stylophora pistillata TaxID=50429 RepID=A0A2B4RK20_STYPI|nr:RNA-directed DNA polymerase from mobile element jockey [Stylophora pistillata]